MARRHFERGVFGGKGTGVFTCRVCDRSTRDTGDNGSCQLCPQCYELSSIENAVSDADDSDMVLAEYRSEIDRHFAVLRTKGVKPEALFDTLATEEAKS